MAQGVKHSVFTFFSGYWKTGCWCSESAKKNQTKLEQKPKENNNKWMIADNSLKFGSIFLKH